MKISHQISDMVKPLENLYSNNVSSMGMVNTSQSKMLELLSNSAVCLGQISTIFQQHFVQTKVQFQNKTQQLLYNIRKTQKIGVIDGRIVINKNQNIASSIISLCETMVNNLSRWITTNSKIFRESPFGQISPENRRKGEHFATLGTAESKRCVYCQQIMEAVKIKSIKQSILDNTSSISGMQSIIHFVRNQREQQCNKNGKLFSSQQDLSFEIINLLRKCDFFQSQDNGKDFLNSDFWERIQVNNYQKEKDKYYAKTSPFLNNWLEQEKLKDRTYTQNKIQPQQFSHPSKIDIKMVDGLISTMLKLFKQHFGKKQIMIKFKNFISSLNLQETQQVALTKKQSTSQNKKIQCKSSCQCPCQLKKEHKRINSSSKKQQIKSKNCQSVIELGKSSNLKKQQIEKQRLLENDKKQTYVKQMKMQDEDKHSFKSSKSDNSSQLLDTVNEKQCAKQIPETSNHHQIAVAKCSNEKETKQKVSKIERNSKCESQRANQDVKKQFHGQRRKIRASQSQIQLSKKKNNNQRASSRFRESVFRSMIKKSRQFSISSIQMKNMVEKGIQCNFETQAHLLQKDSSEKQPAAKMLNNRQNSSADQCSIYSKQAQKSELIQKQQTRSTVKFNNNGKMGVSNRKRAANTHTNEQIRTCLQQNQKNSMQRTSSTLKQQMRNTLKDHKTRVSMLDDITNYLPLIQLKTSKKLGQPTQAVSYHPFQQNQTASISSTQIEKREKMKKKYRTVFTEQHQVKNANISNSSFENKNKIQQLASQLNFEGKLNRNKNMKKKSDHNNNHEQIICVQAVNKISKNQIYQNMFSLVDLELFGGLSCSKKVNRQFENGGLNQGEKIMSQLLLKHICQLTSYRNSLYQTVISFLCHPYETIQNGTIIKSETSKKQLQNVIQYLLVFHKKRCNSIDCEHILRFKNKIMFQFL